MADGVRIRRTEVALSKSNRREVSRVVGAGEGRRSVVAGSWEEREGGERMSSYL